LAKVESGTVSIEMTHLSLGQLRSSLLREFEHVAGAKGLQFSVDLVANCPSGITTDAQRLRQVLTNLLANAFKFTEEGQVSVSVGVVEDGWSAESETLAAASSVIAFSVSDTGIGIESEQQQRIFEAFAQGDGTTSRRFGGTGLGLSITRSLIELLGGEITVTSTLGQGSTFTAYLPVERTVSEYQGADPSEPAHSRPHEGIDGLLLVGAKVLVVDDDFRNVFAMTALLERCQVEVSTAESGAEAIALLKRRPDIDLVLMDIMMPGMDGYAAMRTIHSLGHCHSLPVVAVTSKVVVGERERCLEAGAKDYVSKPVDVGDLLAAIGPWLPKREQLAQ
jgi:two-component system chemotaxis sensor kinase CheA